jgi:uncharacterized membrane protein (DUF2068 family)
MIRKPLLAGMRTVAVVEAAKAVLVLAAGFGLLALIHHDVQAAAERLVRHSHLNPAGKYPRIFLDAAQQMTDTRLWLLAAFAALYSLVRSVEAYGLWYERRWAEWFAMASGSIYVPVEVYELFHHFTWLKLTILAVNVGIVAYMAYALMHSADQDRELAESAPPPKTG